jgi:hypothetical protein
MIDLGEAARLGKSPMAAKITLFIGHTFHDHLPTVGTTIVALRLNSSTGSMETTFFSVF